jgi:hypothetical protein
MLLNSIQTLSSFPFEKIGIFLDDTIAPESSARMGIRLKHNTWDYDIPQINWGNFSFKQVGAEPDLLRSVNLSSYYDADYTGKFVQPGNFIEIPESFPVFFETSAIPNNHILLTFKGGTSAITIFPSRPYPVLQKIDSSRFSVSGGYLAQTAIDEEITPSKFYSSLDLSALEPLTNKNGAEIKFASHSYMGPGSIVYQMYPDGYFSSSRESFVLKTQGNNSNTLPLVNQLIPVAAPYAKGIIPESFQMTFTVSAVTLAEPIDYTIGYGNTVGAFHYLSGINLEGLTSPILNSARLDAINAKLNLTLNTGYFVPKGENYLVTYQASALPYIKSTTSTFRHGISAISATNYFQISSQLNPYFYNYKFNVDYNAARPDTEAFTIFFKPVLYTNQIESSSFYLSAMMHDNYDQIVYPITNTISEFRFSFTEENNDLTLSAIDLNDNKKYIQNQWIPASACLKFINNGIANSFTISPQLSTFKDDIYYPKPKTFILNKELATASLSISSQTDNWAVVIGSIFPNFDPDLDVKWEISPSNNIHIYDYASPDDLILDVSDPSIISIPPPIEISRNTLTPANSLAVIVNNLGVDITKITMYSAEFDLSATTYWIPPSSVYNNIGLQLEATINDFNPIKTAEISANFVKNNLIYPSPVKGSIVWKETNNDPRGSTTIYGNGLSTVIFEDVIYPASDYTNVVDATFVTNSVDNNPQRVLFNFNSNVFGNKSGDPLADTYNLSDNLVIPIRQYPSNTNIIGSLTASDGQIFNTTQLDSKFFLSNNLSVTAMAITSQFSSIAPNGIWWNIDGTIVNSVSTIFSLTDSKCIYVSALSARPTNLSFGYYNFYDELCINLLPSSYPALDYFSFPEYSLFPTVYLTIDDDLNYLNSLGLSGLSGCTTNVTISTFGGFDTYYYRIGSKTISSTNNIQIIPIVHSDISASGIVSVSAFNNIFPIENALTIYNFASSDNSSVFRQVMSSVPVPTLNYVLNAFDTNQNIKLGDSFNIKLSFPFTGMIASSGNYTYLLSSVDGIIYSTPASFAQTVNESFRFTTNPSNFFSIKENSYETLNFQITGNIVKNVVGGPNCSFIQQFSTGWTGITAYDGPDLEIWTPHHIYTTGQVVSVFNKTTEFPDPFTEFRFSKGTGPVLTGLSYSDVITATYASEGTYNISLSAFHPTNPTTIKTWDNYFIIKNSYTEYDARIIRTFPDDIILPYQKSDILVDPNEWQWNTTVNDKLQKIYTNFETLSSLCYSWDINVPKNTVGWYGERGGKTRWIYEVPPSKNNYSKNLTNLKDLIKLGNDFVWIDDNRIEFRTNDSELTLINSIQNITEGELFVNPTHVIYIEPTDKLVILDQGKNNILVFDIDSYALTLTHYWGGVGEASSRTHLNNPVDLYSDQTDIYVVDQDSRNIKIYNSYLNWKNQITYSGWATDYPTSITSSTNYIYVLSEKGNVYVFNRDYTFINSFAANTGNKIYFNSDNPGFLYIVGKTDTYVYTIDGVYVNVLQVKTQIDRLLFDGKEIYGLNSFSVIKLIDFAKTKNIKNNSNIVYSYDSLEIKENEAVTDFVFNDSFNKIHQNLLSLAQSVTSKFIISLDEFDQFVNHTTGAITVAEQLLTTSSFQSLGINEIVSYETINRGLNNICTDMELLRQMIDVRKSRLMDNTTCWTWKYHTIDQAQALGINRRPMSWKELAWNSARFSNSLSAISWKNAYGCGYEVNHMPVHWVWEEMACSCLWAATWEDMECGKPKGFSWEIIEENCKPLPIQTFNDCLVDPR